MLCTIYNFLAEMKGAFYMPMVKTLLIWHLSSMVTLRKTLQYQPPALYLLGGEDNDHSQILKRVDQKKDECLGEVIPVLLPPIFA